jgi:acyl-CoA synthetase (AMP-forming)/AMP-acid ligase II
VPALLPVLLKITDKIGIPRSRVFLFGDKEVEGCRPFNAIIGNKPKAYPIQGVDGYNDTAFICYSSGTTGLAKGVMLTHKNFIAQILQATDKKEDEEPHPDDVTLGFLPFYHIFGLTSLVLNALYTVTPVVVMAKFDLELLCQLIQKYKITTAAIVPPVAVALAKHPIVQKYDLSSIRLLGCGAAPLSKEHIDALYKRVPSEIKQG